MTAVQAVATKTCRSRGRGVKRRGKGSEEEREEGKMSEETREKEKRIVVVVASSK